MNNRKVGILTFHRTTNFGSMLQTFGLYEQIRKMGFDPEIIDYRSPAIEKREQLQQDAIAFSLKNLVRRILYQPVIRKKGNELAAFSASRMRISVPYSPENIKNSTREYDKFLVGSDIVWGLDITEGDKTYFLDFVEDKMRKYAFSSSVGHSELTDSDIEVSSLLKDFSQIAVREEDGATWVKGLTGIDVPVVCDPTMLLTSEEWEKAIPPQKLLDNYVLIYFDNDNHKCTYDALEYAKKHGLKAYFINYGRPKKGIHNIKPTTLNEFFGLIQNANMIFTSSYHGILFSLYFHKQFVFYTRAHKSRVLSLEKKLQLDRCGDMSIDCIEKSINYTEVDQRISDFRNSSIGILQGMLCDGK